MSRPDLTKERVTETNNHLGNLIQGMEGSEQRHEESIEERRAI